MITTYVQASSPRSLQLWIGVFGTENPLSPSLELNGRPQVHEVVQKMRPIADSMTGPRGKPINHRTILKLSGLQPGISYRVTVFVGGEQYEFATRTLPHAMPQKLEGTFNILLCSCYSQPEDGGLLGTIVSQLKLEPHLTLLLGDQIYGDLPLAEDLPSDDEGVARKIGRKYFLNWLSSQLGTAGLGRVLARAPVVCVADDHEYWNNYPHPQTQLPKTWTQSGRAQWQKVALALYEDYQLAGAAGSAQQLDVDPLRILVVDMRSLRDAEFKNLVPPLTIRAIKTWASDLVNDNIAGKPAFGMLVSGQALFTAPVEESRRASVDAEMGNYAQFDAEIMPELDRLAEAGIPVVYVTGDVHWGRVAHGIDVRNERLLLYEVIASPSRLIRVPVLDRAKEVALGLGGILGKSQPWPRHSDANEVPKRLGEKGHFRLECDVKTNWGHAQRGDHVAIMSFAKAGTGIDFNVTYYPISEDKAVAKSCTTRTFELRVN